MPLATRAGVLSAATRRQSRHQTAPAPQQPAPDGIFDLPLSAAPPAAAAAPPPPPPPHQHPQQQQQQSLQPSTKPKRAQSNLKPKNPRQTELGPFCDGFKYEYDCASARWQRSACRLRVAREPFAAGGMRCCFHAEELVDDHGGVVESVAKVFAEPVTAHSIFDECLTQAVAEMHAQAFNRRCAQRGVAQSVAFLPCAVVVLPGGDAPFELATMEPLLPGKYRKHSDNKGGVATSDETAVAFSHFTFINSDQLMVVCDIQGVGDFYTDPQIHTWDGEGFGMGNLGAEGIRRYLHSHVHNELIGRLGLPRLQGGSGAAAADGLLMRAMMESEEMSHHLARGGLEASLDVEHV